MCRIQTCSSKIVVIGVLLISVVHPYGCSRRSVSPTDQSADSATADDTHKTEPVENDDDPPPPGAIVTTGSTQFWHPHNLRWIALAPNNKRLFSIAGDELFHWDVATGKQVFRVKVDELKHQYPTTHSPDYRLLATADYKNRKVHLWELDSGRAVKVLTGFTDSVFPMAFSPDSKWLATAESYANPLIRVWKLADGKQECEFRLDARVIAFAFSSDGSELLTLTDGIVLKKWNVASGELVHERRLEKHPVSNAVFSPDRKQIAVGSGLGHFASIYDVESGQRKFKIGSGQELGNRWKMEVLGFLPDGKTVVTKTNFGVVAVWDLSSGAEKFNFLCGPGVTRLSQDGQLIATVPGKTYLPSSPQVEIWDVKTRKQLTTPHIRTYARPVVSRLALSDPIELAIHWTGPRGPLLPVGRFDGLLSEKQTIESMTFRVDTPSGKRFTLAAEVTHVPPRKMSSYRDSFRESASIFFRFERDGWKSLVHGLSGIWQMSPPDLFNQLGTYRISMSGNIVVKDQQPVPFETGEVIVERTKDALPLEKIRERAVVRLKELLPEKDHGELRTDCGPPQWQPINNIFDRPTHERVVLLSVPKPGWQIDQYRVVVLPDGKVVEITHAVQFTCLAAGTLVDTEMGLRPVEQVRLGDRVWSFDFERKQRRLTAVDEVHRGIAPTTLTIATQSVGTGIGARVTPSHPVYANGRWVFAADIQAGDMLLDRDGRQVRAARPYSIDEQVAVFDLTTEGPHNFFAGGLLVHNKTKIPSPGYYDCWNIFRDVAEPSRKRIWHSNE